MRLGMVVLLSLVACREPERAEVVAKPCCGSYGDFTADGSCFGHGKKCCREDPEADPPCGAVEGSSE